MNEVKSNRSGVHALQVYRAMAVIMVCFYHVYIISSDGNYYGYDYLASIAEPGKYGVNLFFCLSGFIIFYAHWNDFGKGKRALYYLSRRFFRIYPVYWFFLTLYILASYFGLGYPDFSWDFSNIAISYLLIDFDAEATLPLKVAWTLCYEIFFYLVFVFFILSSKAGVVAFSVWGGAIIIANILHSGEVGYRFLEVWNLYFFAGGGLYVISRKFDIYRQPISATILIFIFTVLSFFWASVTMNFDASPISSDNKYVTVVLILSCVATLWLFNVIFSGAFWLESRFYRVLCFIGDSSYSIYLTHSAVMSVLLLLVNKYVGLSFVPYYLAVLVLLLLPILGGTICYRYLEQPFLNYSNGLAKRFKI